jgi:hypothetical protein
MFKGETLGAVGGRLYPWQHGPHAKSGRGGGVPMSGTPSHADVATERWLRFSHCEFMLHTEDSITVFNSRVAPACFTLAPSVTRLGAEAPLRAFQTARLLQATGSVPVTFAVPFCTRPDPGEDDYSLVIGSSFASWRTPCCMGRRMVATTLNLLDHVVPKVGLRQFVFTVPHVGFDSQRNGGSAFCAANQAPAAGSTTPQSGSKWLCASHVPSEPVTTIAAATTRVLIAISFPLVHAGDDLQRQPLLPFSSALNKPR